MTTPATPESPRKIFSSTVTVFLSANVPHENPGGVTRPMSECKAETGAVPKRRLRAEAKGRPDKNDASQEHQRPTRRPLETLTETSVDDIIAVDDGSRDVKCTKGTQQGREVVVTPTKGVGSRWRWERKSEEKEKAKGYADKNEGDVSRKSRVSRSSSGK